MRCASCLTVATTSARPRSATPATEYPIRVTISTFGPGDIPVAAPAPPVEFYAYKEVPAEAVRAGKSIVEAGGIDVGGIEYLESNGERVFYDVNANSNLRAPIAREHGFDPFERVADWLAARASA